MFKPLPSIILSILLFMGCGEPEKITAFKNTNLVPMTDEKIIENQTVLVKGDRIFAIGPANQVEIPPDAKVIEGQGAALLLDHVGPGQLVEDQPARPVRGHVEMSRKLTYRLIGHLWFPQNDVLSGLALDAEAERRHEVLPQTAGVAR